jgi:hypothetical protein
MLRIEWSKGGSWRHWGVTARVRSWSWELLTKRGARVERGLRYDNASGSPTFPQRPSGGEDELSNDHVRPNGIDTGDTGDTGDKRARSGHPNDGRSNLSRQQSGLDSMEGCERSSSGSKCTVVLPASVLQHSTAGDSGEPLLRRHGQRGGAGIIVIVLFWTRSQTASVA